MPGSAGNPVAVLHGSTSRIACPNGGRVRPAGSRRQFLSREPVRVGLAMNDPFVTSTGSGGAVLSYQQCADELGIHYKTFRRNILPVIEVVQISPRRFGVTRAALDAYKVSQTRPPSRAA
jgi:hypothetical protein